MSILEDDPHDLEDDDNDNDDVVDECDSCGSELDPATDDMTAKMCHDCIIDDGDLEPEDQTPDPAA
jgi:hypothetical protein